MKKQFLEKNVYEVLQERFDFLFREFENIYVSFSGGKDSGVLLNLLIDYKHRNHIDKKIGVFHQDFEAQYTLTTEYIERTFEEHLDDIEPYWVCLPMSVRTALSSYEMFWYPWDDLKQDSWVRPLPDKEYAITLENNPFFLYKYKMDQKELAKQFARWYKLIHGNNKTVCLLGIRANESLYRYNGILNKKYCYKEEAWISKQFKDVYCASPIYDWTVNDIWIANYKNCYDYNKLYDLYYKAGLKPNQMRVASPFNDCAKESLNLYRIIDPEIWVKLIGRVQGANFTAIYAKTKAMGYKNITLPEGHTWESYTRFLLETLPRRLRNNYVIKFNASIKFWHTTGGGLSEETIQELENCGYAIKRNGISNYTLDKKSRVIFLGKIPDHTDNIKSTKDIPSWKRMCFCILKNDHICRFMGFALTQDQQRKVAAITRKYGLIDKML